MDTPKGRIHPSIMAMQQRESLLTQPYPPEIAEKILNIPQDDASLFDVTKPIFMKMSHRERSVLSAMSTFTDIFIYVGSGGFISGLGGIVTQSFEKIFAGVGVFGALLNIGIRKIDEHLKKRTIIFNDLCSDMNNLCNIITDLPFCGITQDIAQKRKMIAEMKMIGIYLKAFLSAKNSRIHNAAKILIRSTDYATSVGALLGMQACVICVNIVNCMPPSRPSSLRVDNVGGEINHYLPDSDCDNPVNPSEGEGVPENFSGDAIKMDLTNNDESISP
jgi:hypothetical protein